MTKTKKMATIAQYNRETHNWSHYERRVWADDNGIEYVKANGEFFTIESYQTLDDFKIDIYL